MESVAMAARNAIKTYSGRYYRVGSISHITRRIIAGSVVDYAYGVVKIPLALVMELPSNEYGFQPPVEKIGPLSNESWCGIREMCKQAYCLKNQIDNDEKANNCGEQEDTSLQTSLSMEEEQLSPKNEQMPEVEDRQSSESSEKAERTIKPQFNVRKDILDATPPRSASRGFFSSLLDGMA